MMKLIQTGFWTTHTVFSTHTVVSPTLRFPPTKYSSQIRSLPGGSGSGSESGSEHENDGEDATARQPLLRAQFYGDLHAQFSDYNKLRERVRWHHPSYGSIDPLQLPNIVYHGSINSTGASVPAAVPLLAGAGERLKAHQNVD